MTRLLGITVSAGLDDLLSETESSDLKLKIVVRELVARPDFGEIFNAVVASLRKDKKEEKTPIEESVRLFGIQNAVSFVLAYKISEKISCKALSKDSKTGRLLLPPQQILKHAHEARSRFGEEGRYRDSAFAAGLVFDMISLLIAADSLPSAQKKLVEFADLRFARGIKTAGTAVKLARSKKALKLERHLVAAAMLREAAKAAMAYLYSDYPEYLKLCEANHVPLSIRNLGEQERYGGTYQAISKILSWTFEILSESGTALTRCDTPFMFHDEKKHNEHDLAAICFLAAHIEREPPPITAEKLVRAASLRPELKDLDLTFDLAAILRKEGKS